MANKLSVPESVSNELSIGLRQIASAFSEITDFRGFITAVTDGVQRMGLANAVQLHVDHAPERKPSDAPATSLTSFAFTHGDLNIPVVGQRQLHGVLRISPIDSHHRFGPEDLHALTALTSFLASLADHAHRYADAKRAAEIMRFILEVAPVGFVVLNSSSLIVASNGIARSWLGENISQEVLRFTEPNPPTHMRLGGKLILTQVSLPRDSSTAGMRVISLSDLTGEQTAVIDALSRELYRAKWKKKNLTFVLLEDTRGSSSLLTLLPQLRANFGMRDTVGPYDAHRIGIIFPEIDPAAVVIRLRRAAHLFELPYTKAAILTVNETMSDAEDVLRAALGQMHWLTNFLRPSVLLHDDCAAVNDMLELVLRRDFRVVKSSAIENTLELLRREAFDAMLTELDLREGESGLSLARDAVQLQPTLRPFFTSSASRARRSENDPLMAKSCVFGKPFTVEEIVERLKLELTHSQQEAGEASK